MTLGITLSDGRFIPASRIVQAIREQSVPGGMSYIMRMREGGQEAVGQAFGVLFAFSNEAVKELEEQALSVEQAKQAKDISEAVEALIDMGDPDSLRILNVLSLILEDDWTGSGVYEAVEQAVAVAKASSLMDAVDELYDASQALEAE